MNMTTRALAASLIAASLCTSAIAKGPATFNFGPTGLIGSVSKATGKVTTVHKGSPAEGKLKQGDTIIGANGKKFKSHFRKELADAVNESEAADGKLELLLKGNKKVELQLKVLGSYSNTAPYKCPKSEAIIRMTADHLLEKEKKDKRWKLDNGVCRTALLGLMATGEKKYIDAVSQTIRNAEWARPDQEKIDAIVHNEAPSGYVSWSWGYDLIALAEYHLLTGDESVLPGIKTLAVALAQGQDSSGIWGHRMKLKTGRLRGYAQMNQPSLSCLIGMQLAKKCGINDPDFEKGLERTYAYFENHAGKGAFPYGVHGPKTAFYNNNGTSGSAAIGMALAGNSEGASFFSQLACTTADGMEGGHASTFFNSLWTPLGSAVTGPATYVYFFKDALWLQTMYRCWDGSFSRFGGGSKEGPQAGSALLAYCVPRRVLYITGKDADKSIWLDSQAARTAVKRSHTNYGNLSTDELITMLDSPIPQVTRGASWNLRSKDPDFIPLLERMMMEGTVTQKKSAIGYFGWQCPPEQVAPQIKRIGSILRDKSEDPGVRATAASVLALNSEAAYDYYGDILQLIVDEEPGDRFGDIDMSLGGSLNTLCKTPFSSGLVKDKALFYKAAGKLIDHKWQQAREQGLKMLAEMPLEDFHLMADRISHIIEDQDPSYHSYHAPQGALAAAIDVLANLNIEDGISHTMDVLDRKGMKNGFQIRFVCAALPKYGAHAKDELEALKTNPRFKDIEKGRFGGIWRKMVATIENDEDAPKLISFEDAVKAGK